jgi:hypothetical protein
MNFYKRHSILVQTTPTKIPVTLVSVLLNVLYFYYMILFSIQQPKVFAFVVRLNTYHVNHHRHVSSTSSSSLLLFLNRHQTTTTIPTKTLSNKCFNFMGHDHCKKLLYSNRNINYNHHHYYYRYDLSLFGHQSPQERQYVSMSVLSERRIFRRRIISQTGRFYYYYSRRSSEIINTMTNSDDINQSDVYSVPTTTKTETETETTTATTKETQNNNSNSVEILPSFIINELEQLQINVKSNQHPKDKNNKQQQLWLDLRSTAVAPIEAIRFLNELVLVDNNNNIDTNINNDDEENNNIHRTYGISQYIDTIIVNNLEQQHQSINGIQILQATKNDETLLLLMKNSNNTINTSSSTSIDSDDDNNDDDTKKKINIARIIGTDINDDMILLDYISGTCNSTDEQPQWLLIDPAARTRQSTMGIKNGHDNTENQQVAIRNMIELIVSSMSSSSSSSMTQLSSNGLYLSTTSTKPTSTTSSDELLLTDTTTSAKKTIQLGIFCTTHEMFMYIDQLLAQYHLTIGMNDNTNNSSSSSRTTITSSGLFIPSSSSSSSSSSTTTTATQLQTAIILPFDSQLWRTAINLRQFYHPI